MLLIGICLSTCSFSDFYAVSLLFLYSSYILCMKLHFFVPGLIAFILIP